MLTLYFEMLEKDSQHGNKTGAVQSLTKGVAGYFSKSLASKETRLEMAYVLAKLVSTSRAASPLLIERVGKISFNTAVGLQFIGLDQKLAMAARCLKTLEPRYYAILYTAQLEMLYYFIEPVLESIIKKVQMKAYDSFGDLYDDLMSRYNV